MIRATAAAVVNLEGIKQQHRQAARRVMQRVVICAGTGCMAGGALKVFEAFTAQTAAAGLAVVTELRPEAAGGDVYVSRSGCQGFCQMGPLVTIEPDEILYT